MGSFTCVLTFSFPFNGNSDCKTRGSLRLYSNIETKGLMGESQLVICQSSLLDEALNAAKDGEFTAEREEFLISNTLTNPMKYMSNNPENSQLESAYKWTLPELF